MQRLASTSANIALASFFLIGSLLLAGTLAGCGGERAVLVAVSGAADADRLCLVASDGERVLFSQAYGDDLAGAPAGGTLTFVAGSEVDQSVLVTARGLRSGAVILTATATAVFADVGTTTVPLAVSRCHPRSARAATLLVRDVVRIEAVGPGASLSTGDVDGDGRDEALVLGVGGTLVTVDVERNVAVANAATGAGGRIAAVGDLDGDCSLDPVVVASDGVRVLRGAGGVVTVDPAVSGTSGAVDAALGAAAGGPRIAVCGPAGVSLVAARGATGAIPLGTESAGAVVAVDLTGDRRAEVIAAGPAGTRVWIASDAGFTEAADALPPSFARVTNLLSVIDGDGDGSLDLVGAGADGLFLGLNRGDGLLEDRTGTGATARDAVTLIGLDVDGDCREEVAVLTVGGEVLLYSADASLSARTETFSRVAQIAAGDVDGDGARELVLLGTDGVLRVVSP